MSLLDELQPGSYKGVSFLIETSSVAGGRKDVKHSFPNSDRQAIEDMGLAPRVYTVNAVITGDDYFAARDRFIAVLEEGGPGVLIHPLYGQQENIVARTYTLSENLTSLGDGKISIVFEVSNDIGVPTQSQNTLSLIEAANDTLTAAVGDDIAANYNVTAAYSNSFTDAVTKLDDMVTEINEKTAFVQASADEINAFNQSLNDFSASITSFVQSPVALAESINNLYTGINNLYPTALATIEVLKGLFDFGDDDTARVEDTASRIERNLNDRIMNQTTQTIALGYAYLNYAQIDFLTVEDIDETADVLETQYQKIMATEGLTDETKSSLTDLRVQMQAFFDEQKLTAKQLITINTNPISARLLAYQYYGDSSDGEQIAELNGTDDVTFLEGDVRILTA